jgi:hypothetical protein
MTWRGLSNDKSSLTFYDVGWLSHLRLCRNRKNAHRTHTNIHACTLSVLERAKTVCALDLVATAIGTHWICVYIYFLKALKWKLSVYRKFTVSLALAYFPYVWTHLWRWECRIEIEEYWKHIVTLFKTSLGTAILRIGVRRKCYMFNIISALSVLIPIVYWK